MCFGMFILEQNGGAHEIALIKEELVVLCKSTDYAHPQESKMSDRTPYHGEEKLLFRRPSVVIF